MAKVGIYLTFKDNAEAAFIFYRSVFGGEFTNLQRFKDMPGNEKMPAHALEKLLHVSLPLNENVDLDGSDSMDGMGAPLNVGNNVSILLEVNSKAEADSYYNKLSEGGIVGMPLQDTFWGAYYAQFTDKFGIQWMINFTYPQPK